MLRVLVVAGLLAAMPGPAQALTAMETVKQALRATQAVEDYTAEVSVTVDAPNLQIPRRTATVYFKRPDKVHVESEGLTILPRDALLMGNLAEHIEKYTSASFNGSGTVDGRPVECVKLAPLQPGEGSGRVLTWIDSERHLLLKSEIWRGGRSMLTVRFEWTRVDGQWMPRRIVTSVAAGAMSGDDEGGRIELQFSDYRINRGLPDSLFDEETR